jgi:hypothetical protein
MSLVSVPVHWTSSSQITSAPLVKPEVMAAAPVVTEESFHIADSHTDLLDKEKVTQGGILCISITHACLGICIQWTGVLLEWSTGMESGTNLEFLEVGCIVLCSLERKCMDTDMIL